MSYLEALERLSEQEIRDAQNRTIGVVMAIRLQEQLEARAKNCKDDKGIESLDNSWKYDIDTYLPILCY